MNWATAALGEIFEVARGGSPRPIEDYITDDPEGLNWVLIGDATASGKTITGTKRRIRTEGLSKTRAVKPGDFILSNSMSFGRPYIMGISGCIHDGWLLLRPKSDKIYPDYFYHLLGSSRVYQCFASRAAGATVKNLNSEIVREVEISFPPLDEQRRIAAILDQADDLRRKRREALLLLQSLCSAIFSELFGDPVANNRGWRTARLGDLGSLDRGVSKHRPRNDPALLGGSYPLVQTGEVTNCDGYIRSHLATYSELGLRQSKLWPKGTLCITIAANIGKTGILSFEACFPDSIVGFIPRNDVRTEFIQQWFTFIQPSLERDAPQFAQKNINLAILRELTLINPPFELQFAFAARVAEIDKLKSHHRAHLAKLDALFASLQHRAFRGEL